MNYFNSLIIEELVGQNPKGSFVEGVEGDYSSPYEENYPLNIYVLENPPLINSNPPLPNPQVLLLV